MVSYLGCKKRHHNVVYSSHGLLMRWSLDIVVLLPPTAHTSICLYKKSLCSRAFHTDHSCEAYIYIALAARVCACAPAGGRCGHIYIGIYTRLKHLLHGVDTRICTIAHAHTRDGVCERVRRNGACDGVRVCVCVDGWERKISSRDTC